MKKYRKKPVIVEAQQWFALSDLPNIVQPFGTQGDELCKYCGGQLKHHGWVDTLEGGHIVCPGDWIIKGVKGEYYPCKPDVFDKTYEEITRTNLR